MEILWMAIVFYSIGLVLVLHFRPSLMFNENGTWKEFGYKRSADARHTMFPFWLFAISWAFVSYALAAAITWVYPAMGLTTAVAATAASFGSYNQSEYNDSETEAESDTDDRIAPVSEVVEPPRRGRGRPRKSDVTETREAKQPRPGYYMLEPTTREGGLRKYIYYGSKPPPTEEED